MSNREPADRAEHSDADGAVLSHVEHLARLTGALLNDLLRGSTADRVRHNVRIPVLMVRA